MRELAAETAGWQGNQRGIDRLDATARDTALGSDERVRAARELIRHDYERGADLLNVLANDTALRRPDRKWATRELARLGDQRAQS